MGIIRTRVLFEGGPYMRKYGKSCLSGDSINSTLLFALILMQFKKSPIFIVQANPIRGGWLMISVLTCRPACALLTLNIAL